VPQDTARQAGNHVRPVAPDVGTIACLAGAPHIIGDVATTSYRSDAANAGAKQGTQVDGERAAGAQDSTEHLTIAPIVGPDDPRRFTDSGIEIQPLYSDEDLPRELELGKPGEYPYTRGIHRQMYRGQLWTMRQYAGYASAKESNERYRYLLSKGSTGLSMAFDLPTQLGLDSDDERCLGEVGRTGVAIDTIDDMRTAFDGIPLDQVSTSMTINAPAACLLLLYELVGEEQGVPPEKLRGTTQNDVLKEYIARGNYIYPPAPTMRLTTDIFQYCQQRVPRWNTISISGYHFREKGCSAVQEVAFTLCSGIAYVQAAIDKGLAVDDFAPRLAFFFNGHNNVFQEVAKFRAARRMWARIMRERFGATNQRSMMLRFHTQTGGVTLTAQQPENNIVRVALQAFAAVCGGTQSLHTNGFDEALALPTERAAKIALRTQQIVAYESGAADTVDPFAGSYFVEALTAEIERRAAELIAKVDAMGGSVNALQFITNEIDQSAWGYQERYRIDQDIVVGVNAFQEDELEVPELLRVDPDAERQQLARLEAFKARRDHGLVKQRLDELRAVARGGDNLLPAIRQALKDRCSLGEVCGAMEDVFGRYQPAF
jgi:methylmalonyl-CoA mutase, N-terminal domain